MFGKTNNLNFSSTFEAINDEQTEVSRMQRYRLIREFSSRSMIPPPLCVITYPYFVIQGLRRRCKTFRPQALGETIKMNFIYFKLILKYLFLYRHHFVAISKTKVIE